MTSLMIVLTAILLPLFVMELGNLAPWLAGRLIDFGSSRLGPDEVCERYKEEWHADLVRVPGSLTKLGWAFWVVAWSVPHLRGSSSVTRLQGVEAPMWAALAQPSFRWYFFGSICSNIGVWVQTSALILLAEDLTHSIFMVGLVLCAQFTAALVLGPWCGMVAARIGSRRVMMITQLVSAVIAATLACLLFAGALTVPWLLAGALAAGQASAFALPAQSRIVSKLVPPDYAKAAAAASSLSVNIGRALAPALTLVLANNVGPGYAFAITSLSALIMAAIAGVLSPKEETPRHFRPNNAMRFAWQCRPAMVLLVAVTAVTVAATSPLVLGPVSAGMSGLSIDWYIYLLVALGTGAVIASLRPVRKPTVRKLACYLGLLGASTVLFAVAPTIWVSIGAATAIGFGSMLAGATAYALLVRYGGRDHETSVTALWLTTSVGSGAIAALYDGTLASKLGLQVTGILMAAPIAVVTALMVFGLSSRGRRILPDSLRRHMPDEIMPSQQAVET